MFQKARLTRKLSVDESQCACHAHKFRTRNVAANHFAYTFVCASPVQQPPIIKNTYSARIQFEPPFVGWRLNVSGQLTQSLVEIGNFGLRYAIERRAVI